MKLAFVFDISLRILTIFVRAIFVFYLAKVLYVNDFGRYTYMVASISFFMYLAGADFYAYAHREMLSDRSSAAETLRAQIIFLMISTALASILSVAISWDGLPMLYLVALPLLLAGELFAAECVRFLIVCGRPSAANSVNFLKSAGWMLPLWGWSYYHGAMSIELLVTWWIFGLIVAVLSGVLWTPVTWMQLVRAKVPDGFFQKALRTLPKILLGTLALRALFSLDRLAVGYGFNSEMLGTYGFFVAVASAYLAVIDAGVLARLFPPLVAAAVSNNQLAQQYRRRMEISAVLSGFMAWLIYLLLIDYIISYIGKPQFMLYKQFGSLILTAYVVYAASMGSHYIMYGRKQDIQIMVVHLFAILPFAIMIWLASIWTEPTLVAWGVLLSMCFQFGLKSYLAQRHEPARP